MGSVTVDLSALKNLKKSLEDAREETLQVGWFSSANYDAETPVAQVAFWQEYGTKSAPPRPFFRPAVADNQTKWGALTELGIQAVIDGSASMSDVFNGLGLTVQADVKNAINGQHQALSPVTLALRKLRDDGHAINGTLVGAVASAIARGETGSGQLGEPSANTKPLQDNGIMLASLTYNIGGEE
ncbi:hypothetical protein MAELSTROM_31 [Pseudoalteromonas phage Maelstrom]|uniref:tail completion or Neck1 protein n=1 Tax=Pseudoalteromonas phage Maelstrom TaxID=2065202 RepID=UPI000CA14E8E|nr:tail completion or Neck1 protein [Pseudoalteromonas phage Maelstrom]AUG84951.1 hypothetical protein MAELSTROM_31 [Pseudoalteromonas phage Maelstrom]